MTELEAELDGLLDAAGDHGPTKIERPARATPDEPRFGGLGLKLLNYMMEHRGQTFTAPQAARVINVDNPNHARALLSRLVDGEHVVRVDRGRYAVPVEEEVDPDTDF